METEKQLLEAIRSGERAAMRRLYDRYSGYAMAVGLRYVPEHDDVRDVLQDSFVKILTNIGQFEYRGEGSLKAWVSRIVSNLAIDHLKANSRFLLTDNSWRGFDALDDEDEEPDIGDLPPDVLTEMIGRLPTNYRTVLNLFVFEQRPHKEIARLLGIKENTSSSIFFRAKRMLAKMITEYQNKQRT
ncbi:MAG: RNA polymerase sigma factor [Prevotella sp.]|nr:RNA polymerase sigma factor [Prevotella sp.]